MPRPRRSRSSAPAFPNLSSNIQIGLKRLVSDNASILAQMLDTSYNNNDDGVLELCEKCALVMKQQQLSPALFLARFFDVTMLVNHITLLGKSTKGSAPVLSERIANEWTKGNLPKDKPKKIVKKEGGVPTNEDKKKRATSKKDESLVPKKKKQKVKEKNEESLSIPTREESDEIQTKQQKKKSK